MNQSDMIFLIHESIHKANKTLLRWTDYRHFLGTRNIRSEGYICTIIMQDLMKFNSDLLITPEKRVDELIHEAGEKSQLTAQKISKDIREKGWTDIAVFNKKWELNYAIEVKRDRIRDSNAKFDYGYKSDIRRLGEMHRCFSKMKAGICAVFLFASSKNKLEIEKKLNDKINNWKKKLSEYTDIDVSLKKSHKTNYKWEMNKKFFISTSLCIIVKKNNS